MQRPQPLPAPGACNAADPVAQPASTLATCANPVRAEGGAHPGRGVRAVPHRGLPVPISKPGQYGARRCSGARVAFCVCGGAHVTLHVQRGARLQARALGVRLLAQQLADQVDLPPAALVAAWDALGQLHSVRQRLVGQPEHGRQAPALQPAQLLRQVRPPPGCGARRLGARPAAGRRDAQAAGSGARLSRFFFVPGAPAWFNQHGYTSVGPAARRGQRFTVQTASPPLRLFDVRLAARTTSVSAPGAAAAQAMLCKRLERGAGLHWPWACRAVVQVWRLASSAHALPSSRSGRWPGRQLSSSRQHCACITAQACDVLSSKASAHAAAFGLHQVTECCHSRCQPVTALLHTSRQRQHRKHLSGRPDPSRALAELKSRGLRTCSKNLTSGNSTVRSLRLQSKSATVCLLCIWCMRFNFNTVPSIRCSACGWLTPWRSVRLCTVPACEAVAVTC